MDFLLAAKNLTKRFGGIIALKDVNISIAENDFIGLIGPNGSGKTTLVNVITGVYKPDSGSIWFAGRRIDGLPSHKICRMGIARTFQIPQPLSDMTVIENVMISSVFCGDSDENHVWKVLRTCGLEDKAYQEASKLTLVEKRMLELARALAAKPRLLFLDEVAAGLRKEEIEKLADVFKTLNESGLTMVWVEHNVGELVKYVRKLIVMDMGSVIAEGGPWEVVKMPRVIDSYLGKMVQPG